MSKTKYFARRRERAADRSSGQPVGALPGKLRETRWSGEGCAVWRRVGGLKRGSCATWVGGCEPQVVLSPLESPTGPRRSHPGLEKVSWGPGGGRLKGQVRGCECWANVSRREGRQALGAPHGAGPWGHGQRSPAGPPGRRKCRGPFDSGQGAPERLSHTHPPAFREVFSLLPSSSGINPGLGRHRMVPLPTSLMSSVLVTVMWPQGSVLTGRVPFFGPSFGVLLGEWL